MTTRHLLGFFSLACAAAITGCEQAPNATVATTALELANTKCPVMGNPVNASEIAPELIREWNGKKVGFCCPPCLEDWAEMTDAERAEKLANPPAGAAH
ncbi:MAG: hypothetical protein RLZZ436_3044 [Planctomycetota bacterium]|jgi:hypothetical protein